MKRALIIHGWESGSTEHWYQEEKKALEAMGYEVVVPDMPNSFHPDKDDWVQIITDFAPDKESVLIGHSLGAPTILRYLEKTEQKIGTAVLVAGFASDLGFNETRKFVVDTFDWEKIRNNADKFVVLNQIDDPWVPLAIGQKMADNLEEELVKVTGNNHFDTMDLSLINKELT
jgi:uncharacterized protein